MYTCGVLIQEVCGSSFTHGTLMSALNSRSHDYKSPSLIDESSGAELKNYDKNNGDSSAELERPNRNGGEVLVPKLFPTTPQEPTCEQLRAMWIFSKRQARAAEITNEIPTYRDPFLYNMWEPYYSATGVIGTERAHSPVFGRVVSREPVLPQRSSFFHQRQRHVGDTGSTRIFGSETKPVAFNVMGMGLLRTTQSRHVGTNGPGFNNGGNINSIAVQGSFQKLKELIWTERAKQLTQQRRAEELAARAAVLKDIANGRNIHSIYKNTFNFESPLMDENRSPDTDKNQFHNKAQVEILSEPSRAEKYFNNMNTKNNTNVNKNYRDFDTSGLLPHNNIDRNKDFKWKMHLGNSGSTNSDQAGRFLPTKLLASAVNSDSFNNRMGSTRTYPMRQSHFRERNQSLLNPNYSRDYFDRQTRFVRKNWSNINGKNDNVLMRHNLKYIIEGILQNKGEEILTKANFKNLTNLADYDLNHKKEDDYYSSEDIDYFKRSPKTFNRNKMILI